MKNLSFIYSLLVVFALLSCSKTKFTYEKKIYLSTPEVMRFTLDDQDSIAVKGVDRCEALEVVKGKLPENVAKESGYDKSYYYCTYEATVEMEDDMDIIVDFFDKLANFDDMDKLVFPKEKVDVGYSTIDFEGKGFMQVSDTKDGHKYVKLYTYLVHIFKDENGEEADIWYPHSPFELEWTFFSIDK